MTKWIGAVVGISAVMLVLYGVGSYNNLVALDQGVQAQWGQVQNTYQRRADLVPNLVRTVQGAANFEKGTLTEVTQARAQVGQVSAAALESATRDPAALQRFQAAQDALSSALTRLMAISERYPELKATENFRDLQAQLEGTENRIAVERMRFNEAAQAFNTYRNRVPIMWIAGAFGGRFAERAYFEAPAGAAVAPPVIF